MGYSSSLFGQDGRILHGQIFSCVYMDREKVQIYKLAKQRRGQYPAILTEQAWLIKDLYYMDFGEICVVEHSG